MGADQKIDWTLNAVSTLDWWQEAGVDVVISEAPRNWLLPEPAKIIPSSFTPVEPATPNQSAATLTPAPVTMPQTIPAFLAWRLGPDAPDFGWSGEALGAEGCADAPLMVVIEMPERGDAVTGALLSGDVGRLFTRMLGSIGHDRESIYLVSMCVRRPSSGRIPAETEPLLAAALRHQVALASAKRVLIFGNAVSRALLGADMAERRGLLQPINQKGGDNGTPVQAIASFHPRFLLERPAAKAEAWKDLQLLIQGIDA